jgi:hypothetical protein
MRLPADRSSPAWDGPAQELLSELGIDAESARARLGIEHKDDAERLPSRMVIPRAQVGFVIKLGFQAARTLSATASTASTCSSRF